MGSHFLEVRIKAKDKKELMKRYQALVDTERSEYGTDPYSGSWATIPNVTVVPDPVPDMKRWTKKKFWEVGCWLSFNTDKWEPAKAVKTTAGYIVGGWAIS